MYENTQMAFLYEIFDAGLPRLGPGDAHTTRKALDMLLAKSLKPAAGSASAGMRVLDLGCGNGAQTIALAQAIAGTILAVDNHQPFLDELRWGEFAD